MPRIIPEERYFSMPSIDVGADVRRNRALNCWPWVRSLTHSPVAVIHSPADIVAEWPTTVTRSRCPRALVRRSQKPFSALWKVTRSTRPARAPVGWVTDPVSLTTGRPACLCLPHDEAEARQFGSASPGAQHPGAPYAILRGQPHWMGAGGHHSRDRHHPGGERADRT